MRRRDACRRGRDVAEWKRREAQRTEVGRRTLRGIDLVCCRTVLVEVTKTPHLGHVHRLADSTERGGRDDAAMHRERRPPCHREAPVVGIDV